LGKSIFKARTLGEIGSILYVISLVFPNLFLLIGALILLLLSVMETHLLSPLYTETFTKTSEN